MGSKRYHMYNPTQYSHIPVSEIMDLARVYLLSKFECYYCGKLMSVGGQNAHDACTLDHRIPLSRGGTNAIENLVLCCRECNIEKDSEIYEGNERELESNTGTDIGTIESKNDGYPGDTQHDAGEDDTCDPVVIEADDQTRGSNGIDQTGERNTGEDLYTLGKSCEEGI